MIFGNIATFALEVDVAYANSHIFVNLRMFVGGVIIGDFDEGASYGPIALSIGVFMKFSRMRNLNIFGVDAFDYLYGGIYGERWREELSNNLRARFSLHDLFDLSIADRGHRIFLINHDDRAEILLGMADGVYQKSSPVELGYVEKVLSDFMIWVEASREVPLNSSITRK